MEIERDIRLITMGDQAEYEAEMRRLAAEGWRFIPEVPPVVIYHLVREKQDAQGMQVHFGIDESKIGILRNGKLIS